MRKALSVLTVASLLLFAVSAMAADRVVVIPLGGAKHYMYWQGDWAADSIYKVGDAVHMDGSSYMCTAEHMSTADDFPPNATYWALIAAKGDTGQTGIKGDKGDTGTAGTDGLPGTKGDKGDQGDPGTPGAKGDTGDIGATGSPGFDGAPGAIGDKGDKGDQGIQGPVGVSPNQRCPYETTMIGIDADGDIMCNYRTVFVSSAVYTGNLGGLSGADAKCSTLATNAGLSGVYLAWLSDGTTGPTDRFTRAKSQYILTDGTVIAENWDDLGDGTIKAGILVDENGVAISGTMMAWTNVTDNGDTYAAGLSGNPTCFGYSNDETSYYGVVGKVDNLTRWSQETINDCDILNRVICISQ